MKRIFYIVLQDIQALFLLFVIMIGIIILWLKGELKFDK
jgi:hypothetical protein